MVAAAPDSSADDGCAAVTVGADSAVLVPAFDDLVTTFSLTGGCLVDDSLV